MGNLTWTCSICKSPIVGDTGYVGAENEAIRSGGPVKWAVYHDACRPDDHLYSVDVATMTDTLGVDRWTEHLSAKKWYLWSNWRQIVLAETGYAIPLATDWRAGRDYDPDAPPGARPLSEVLASARFTKAELVDALAPLVGEPRGRETATALVDWLSANGLVNVS